MTAKNLRQFEFKLGKLGILLFLAGFTVVVFAGFLLGVQVGRNIDTYPEWIARGIPIQILDLLGPPPGPVRRDVPVGKPGVALFDAPAPENQTGKAMEGEKGSGAAPPVIPGPTPQTGETGALPGGATTAATQPVERVPEEAAPAKKEKDSPTAETKEKPEKEKLVKGGRYAVQVVSFREKEKAEILGKKIRSLGYTPQIAKTDISGKGEWYRVTVEGFETKQAAEKAVENLTAKIKGIRCVIKGK